MAVELYLGQRVEEMVLQAMAQVLAVFCFVFDVFLCECTGFPHAHNARYIERARAHAFFMAPAVYLADEANARATAHIERACAFGSVEFVGRDGEEVDVHGFDIERVFANGLCCVCVEIDVFCTANRPDFFYCLAGADFVIGRHDGDKRGVVCDGVCNI